MIQTKKTCWRLLLVASSSIAFSVSNQLAGIAAQEFDISLQLNRYPKNVQNWQWLDFFRQLYVKNNLERVTPCSTPRIPLIIHHIWLGSKLPQPYAQLRKSWFTYNPDWTFVFWTDDPVNYDQGILVTAEQLQQELLHAQPGKRFVVDVSTFSFENKHFYDTAKNYGERSDLLRYDVMNTFGGLYADTDCECFKPFNLLHQCYDFYAGLHPLDTSYLQVATALFGTVPHHPIMEACVKTIKNTRHIIPIVLKTGPLYFTRIFYAIASQQDKKSTEVRTVIFPPTYFYPCDYNQRGAPQKEWLRPESFSVHHWEGSWLKAPVRKVSS